MLIEADKIQKHLQGFIDYSSSMFSLWSQCVDKSLEQANRTALSLIKLNMLPVSTTPDLLNDSVEYVTDFLQRSILFWDIIGKRGNQYLEHEQAGQPPVLIFSYKLLIDGRKFKRAVNYALVEIIPPENLQIDPTKRPYVIVDPRAGHGAGISGFKDDSQVGIALKAGHPVYVVIFFPLPEPDQTLMDVTAAHEKFLNEIALRHPQSPKPCIIGNCQGGWAILTLMAANSDIAGVAVVNGAPLSYWGGETGKNPMRYLGGLLGGSWLAQLAGDLGNGKFDGANLVMNFEMANPKTTCWEKYYNLFANIDTEETRFLDFERWWGGFSLMNVNEMRGIVENLFIGNKLVHGKIPLGESAYNLDLRDINVPVIVFCSEGDTITPPQQALNWIADLYTDELDIKLQSQVIVYLIHESIGHLGIFVSSAVAKKEHHQIIDLLNYIEHLSPGLYELKLHDVEEGGEGVSPHYMAHIEERSISDIRSRQKNGREIFNHVRMISEYNSMTYDLLVGPIVRIFSNEYSSDFIRRLHPLRQNQYLWSNLNPFLHPVFWVAPMVRENRVNMSKENFFFLLESHASSCIGLLWELTSTSRDTISELLFYAIYGFLRLWMPFDPRNEMIVHNVEDDYYEKATKFIVPHISDGGAPEAVIRILLLLIKSQGYMIAANVQNALQKIRKIEALAQLDTYVIKQIVHTQTVIIEYDPELAFSTLPHLLRSRKDRQSVLHGIEDLIKSLKIPPSKGLKEQYQRIKKLLSKNA